MNNFGGSARRLLFFTCSRQAKSQAKAKAKAESSRLESATPVYASQSHSSHSIRPVPQNVRTEARQRDEHGLLRPDRPAALAGAGVDPHVKQGGRLAPRQLQGFVGVHGGLDSLNRGKIREATRPDAGE